MSCKDHRIGRCRAIRTNGMHVLVELMEHSMRQPGFVEVKRSYLAIEQFAQRFYVVDDSVVRALRDR